MAPEVALGKPYNGAADVYGEIQIATADWRCCAGCACATLGLTFRDEGALLRAFVRWVLVLPLTGGKRGCPIIFLAFVGCSAG